MSTQTEEYDVLILGTGVTEAILAGALAKAGKRVVHVDSSDSYGGSGKALSVDAFLALPRLTVSQPPHESVLKEARKYALEMTPKLIYGNGELVEAMISSAVANYLEFRAVEGVSLLWDGRFETVPCSKEDVFKNDSIPLLEKRRLMKLLSKVNEGSHSDQHDPNSPFKVFLEAQGLTERSQASLFYGVGQLIESKDANATLAQGFAAIKRFLGSIGRFGSTPFLSGVYGTASEISQAFCRVCAVFGGTYMLGFTPTSILESADRFTVTSCESDATPDEDGNVPPVSITCSWIVASASSCAESNGFASVLEKIARVEAGSAKHVSRCICVRDCGMDEVGEPGLFVVPAKDGRNAVVGIQHSGSALVCPDGKYILYLMAQASESGTAEEDLQDALREVLATTPDAPQPLLTVFYSQTLPASTVAHDRVLVTHEFADASVSLEECVVEARALFDRIAPGSVFYPPTEVVLEDE